MTHSKSAQRPEKPYEDFPLFAAANGQWAKKIKGQKAYFGSWSEDPKGTAALAKYHDEIAGRPAVAVGLSIGELCNRFLNVKEDLADAGELVRRTFKAYKGVTDVLVEHFGKPRVVDTLTTRDFEDLRKKASESMGPVSTGNFVNITRMVFKYAFEANLIDRPVRFGPTFKRAPRKLLRKARAKKGAMMFAANEIHQLLDAADVQMRAMILLGANCGFGNADVGQLPISAIDFKKGWVQFPRPKTGIDRRCPLWPETLEAIRAAIDKRKPAHNVEHEALVFITKYGDSWHKETSDNPVCQQFKKLLQDLKLYRKGLGFYSLRRGFETIGGDSADQVAVDYIMGHAEDARDMAAVYRQSIFDQRLQKVADHVHAWLYPPKKQRPVKNRAQAK